MTTRQKIHILVTARWPVGGIRTFFRYVYTRFRGERFRFTFILPDTTEHQTIVHDLRSLDVSFIKLASKPGFVDFFRAMCKVHRTDEIDLIHSHGFTAGIFSILTAKLFRIPHLMTSHDVFTYKQFSGTRGRIKKSLLPVLFKHIDCIHCVGEDAKGNLLRYFPHLASNNHRIISISNGIEIQRFLTEEKEDLRKELGLSEDSFLIGFFGRFMAQKGFRYLVDAIEILRGKQPQRQPVVVCFGWGGFVREEQAAIRKRGLIEYFRFLPFRSNVAPAMRGLDMVAMPSLWEAYPLLAAEALVAGVPLIGTDCVGLREVLHDTPARSVPAGDAMALAGAIETEMLQPSGKVAQAFRRIAAQRFDVQKQADELQKIMVLLINGKRTN